MRAAVLVRLAGFGWLAAGQGHAAETAEKVAAVEVRIAKSPEQVEAEALYEGKTLAGLIPLLGDERFAIRQATEDKLHQLLHEAPTDQPNEVEILCFETYRTHSNPEIRMRARAVLVDFATTLWAPECFLGLAIEPDFGFDEDGNLNSRLKINKVIAKSPAAIAGIQASDFLRGMDEVRFTDANAATRFTAYLSRKRPGDKVTLHLEHEGKNSEITVTLGCKPRALKRAVDDKPVTVTPAQCLREYLAFKMKK